MGRKKKMSNEVIRGNVRTLVCKHSVYMFIKQGAQRHLKESLRVEVQ